MNLKVLSFAILFLVSLTLAQIEQTTQVITPEGGKIELEICGYAEFPEGFLIETAEISFSCSIAEETYYPENFGQIVEGAELVALGHNTVVVIPASAIDATATNPEDTKVLKVRVPPTIMYERNAMAEIRYKLDDGTELFGFDSYNASKSAEDGLAASQIVPIRLSELAMMVDSYTTQTITVSIVPTIFKGLLDQPSQRTE